MDLPPPSDYSLAHPTRARLFGLLRDLRRPAGTDELAARLGLHPNGVRLHLARLRAAGLVTRDRVRQPRGRPRDMWTIASEARPGGEAPTGYAQLGRWLVRALAPPATGARKLEATGRLIGRELAPGGDGSVEEMMRGALTSLGFQPQSERAPAGTLAYRLGNCPYRDAARDSPDVVCTLHRGITRGLLDVIAPHTRLSEFEPEDPDAGGCLIRVGGVTPAPRAKPTA